MRELRRVTFMTAPSDCSRPYTAPQLLSTRLLYRLSTVRQFRRQVRGILVGALGGLLFGFDTAVIAGTRHSLRILFALSPAQLGFTVASARWAREASNQKVKSSSPSGRTIKTMFSMDHPASKFASGLPLAS